MLKLKNIQPLSDFVRNTKERMAQLEKSRHPMILTVNGEAKAVLLSADAYEEIIERLETIENVNAIHKGMLEAQRGEGVPADELMRRLRGNRKARKSA